MTMRTTWSFYTAGQLTFGPGAVRQLGELVARHRLSRIFVVTDKEQSRHVRQPFTIFKPSLRDWCDKPDRADTTPAGAVKPR
jgi:hypothetical protein